MSSLRRLFAPRGGACFCDLVISARGGCEKWIGLWSGPGAWLCFGAIEWRDFLPINDCNARQVVINRKPRGEFGLAHGSPMPDELEKERDSVGRPSHWRADGSCIVEMSRLAKNVDG